MPKSQKSISITWWETQLAKPQITALIVMMGIAALIIHQMLPCGLKYTLATIVTYPVVTAVILTVIMILGYFNWLAGLVALCVFVFILFPYNKRVVQYGLPKTEGFTSNEDNKESDNYDMLDTTQIKSLFQPGFLSKKLKDARELTREVAGETAARAKMEQYIDKRTKIQSSNNTSGREKFANGGDKAIPMRRFNPGSEEDANLLLTMDAMDDIKDRIKYKYEDKKYLKRYIRQKLEEVVDLLELVNEEE